MRADNEVQRAHDQLAGILLGEVPLKLSDDSRAILTSSMHTLCWVLQHKESHNFGDMIRGLEKECEKLGYVLPPLNHPTLPIPLPISQINRG